MVHFTRRHFIQRSALLALLFPSLAAKASAQSDTKTAHHIQQWFFTSDDWVPNHPELPVMHIADASDSHQTLLSELEKTGWSKQWQGKPFSYLHFHSRTHVIFVVTAGSGELRVGGNKGKTVLANVGDMIFLPAGTGQQHISSTPDFAVSACYLKGKSWDVCRSAINPETLQKVSMEKLNKGTRHFFSQQGAVI
ncbi:cupin domain-containing protein [Pantoea rwandensis]|uniref:Cupin type-1 domain-containing protein n=1 Tax=Pantoea rwandensis TaxID=1076550 RepID=A0A1X1D3R0_9GAMM|nr:cupin domain-containing protein [Pantoea rwandensis]ORM71161.1 hypothetical protein HA51_04585 [Pantoea rwandensis]